MAENTPKKPVASVSFFDNHSMSVDVESVKEISLGPVMEITESGPFFLEVIIRTDNGNLSLQLVSDQKEKLTVQSSDPLDDSLL